MAFFEETTFTAFSDFSRPADTLNTLAWKPRFNTSLPIKPEVVDLSRLYRIQGG